MSARGEGALALAGGVARSRSARSALWAYLRYVWYAGPTLALDVARRSTTSCSRRGCSGIALLAPYFLWMIGR